MILTLTDGHETVLLALILRAVGEEKPISEVLSAFIDKERVPLTLEQIRKFARTKLNHQVLKLAIEEADQLLCAYAETKTRYERK